MILLFPADCAATHYIRLIYVNTVNGAGCMNLFQLSQE